MKPLNSSAPRRQSPRLLLPVVAVLSAAAAFPFLRGLTPTQPSPVTSTSAVAAAPTKKAQPLQFRVVRSIPHDSTAFTQGLLWSEGGFYESTGLNGRSSVRRLEYPSGKVLYKTNLPRDVFGEGLTEWKDRLIQISWQSQKAFVYDRKTLKLVNQWNYEGEGWGITQNGQHLIMSDGSDTLTFRDPESFQPLHQIAVTFDGRPLRNLNELEWIEGRIWANIWQTDTIVAINPTTGRVESYLNCAGLLPPAQRVGGEDVLNGIAYDSTTKRLWLTGKLWPKIFEVKLEK